MPRRGRGEGSISFRQDRNIWQGVVTIGYDANGKRKRRVVYGKTKQELQNKLTRLQGQKLDGTLGDPCKLRLSEYLQHWLENAAARSVRESTLASYRDVIRLHVDPHIGGVQLARLEAQHVESLLRRLEEAGLSSRRQQMVIAVLRRALNIAVQRGLIHRNVTAMVQKPKVEQREMHPLTPAEAKRFLLAAQGDRLQALYVLAVTTGMRQGELFGLEWRDIDLDEGVLWVRRTLNEINGRFLTGPPKTKRGMRRIRLPQVAITALRQHQRLMQAEGHGEQPRVFCDQTGGPLRRQNLLRRSFKPLLKQGKCPDVRFHDLRHTYATLALSSGVPLRVVSDTLGHCRSSVTIDTYAHVLPSQERTAADAMDAAFGDVG